MITVDQMIQREVFCCLSSLVSTLASGYGASMGLGQPARELESLAEQAFELACPVPDYEEAAVESGWSVVDDAEHGKAFMRRVTGQDDEIVTYVLPDDPGAWETLCSGEAIEPYEWEVFEHWAVSTWLAEKLIAQGEKVDTDFASMNVWARTTTGQGIANDTCIQNIYADLVRL